MAETGKLYIVATPIGNLDDISIRAVNILHAVDVIAVEDSRHSQKLFAYHAINKPTLSLHEHNEQVRSELIIERLQQGQDVALISDAGTPLISDPGFILVRKAYQQNIKVVPIPGACAAISALCASGMATDRFLFVGFLPHKGNARHSMLAELLQQPATTICYESPHRIMDLLNQIADLAAERELTLAKEISKAHERFLHGKPLQIRAALTENQQWQKGEWVVVISGAPRQPIAAIDAATLRAVALAAEQLPLKKACALVAEISGHKKNQLYQAMLDQKQH